MRRILFTAMLLIFSCSVAFAQETDPLPEFNKRQKRKQIKDPYLWKTQRPRHEAQFGLGDPVIYFGEAYDEYYYSPYEKDINWFGSDAYTKTRIYTPAISATYHYRLLKWLSVGGFVSYSGTFSQKTNIITGEDESLQDHFITIAPSVRFTYMNRKYVTLYSGLAAGITYQISVNDMNTRMIWSSLGAQLTAFGVSVGHKWFGYTEVGYGNKGIVTAGFGYRFNSKNIQP